MGSASPWGNQGGGPGSGPRRGLGLHIAPGPGSLAGCGRWCEGRDTPPFWGRRLRWAARVPRPGWAEGGREESTLGVPSAVWELEVRRVGRGEGNDGTLVWGGLSFRLYTLGW